MSKTPFLDAVPGKGVRFHVVDRVGEYDYDYWNGRVLVWEEPQKGQRYVIGFDPAEGSGEDRSVIEVLRAGDRERPDEQVAEFASDHHNPLECVPILNALGRMYCEDDGSEALCVVECNTVGGADAQLMLRTQFEYTNLFVWKVYDKRTNLYTTKLGWWTNRTTRPKLIVRGMHALQQGDLLVNSPFLLDEMEDFERDPNTAKIKAKYGRHDDRVLAFLIAHVGAHDDEWIAGEDVAGERRALTRADGVKEVAELKTGSKASWQNTACSAREMYAEWDDRVLDE